MNPASRCILPLALAGLAAACASPASRVPGPADGAAIHVDVPAIARPGGETPAWWYRSGAARAAANGAMAGRARNVIVFLGDGMGPETVAAARILAGQRAGGPGEEHLLAWEHFPATAFSRTYNTDAQTPDSAGTMTAIATGVKSHKGAIGVAAGDRDDCAGSHGRQLRSWLALAADAGMGTGIVTTARLSHATPAATYAHAPDRRWEHDGMLPEAARAAGCTDIASQFIEFARTRGAPQVALAGGAREFQSRERTMAGGPGRRHDGRDLAAEWQALHPDGAVVHDTAGFEAAQGAPAVLGLFEPAHMQYDHDRDRGPGGEPDLEAMTRFAIEALSRRPEGFVLLVEGARIDTAHHEGNAFRALDETVSLSRAVAAALEMTSADDTLVVVTADHAHGLALVGQPTRGNPILGRVVDADSKAMARDALGLPYTAIAYASGPGYTGPRPDLAEVDTAAPHYRQEALVPREAVMHGGADVGIWARGPGSGAFRGSLEQHVIFHVIVQATPRLRAQLCAEGFCDANGVPALLPTARPGDAPLAATGG